MAERLRLAAKLTCVVLTLLPGRAVAGEALIAVATNFAAVAEELVAEFRASSAETLRLSSASTGTHYAQIKRGAPFDAFLAADQARPEKLLLDGLAVPGSRFTFAVGRLALWMPGKPGVVAAGLEALRAADVRILAIASPAVAPYGRAAQQVLERLSLLPLLKSKLAFGQNVGHVHAMVATGNADAGLLAWSYLLHGSERAQAADASRHWYLVPAELHDPIRQDAVLLQGGKARSTAQRFLRYLRSASARGLISQRGYELD